MRVTRIAIAVVTFTVLGTVAEANMRFSAQVIACENGSSAGGTTGSVIEASDACSGSSPPGPRGGSTPKQSTYCDAVNKAQAKGEPGEPKHTYSPASVALGLYRYPDGREDSQQRRSGYEVAAQVEKKGDRKPSPYRTVLVKNGGTPTYEKYKIWCGSPGVKPTLEAEVWVPLMTPDALAEWVDLFARVEQQLENPKVEFVDSDLEHGWLWVQVDHRLAVAAPVSVYESETDTDETGWASPSSVEAWLRATPVALTIRVESDAGEQYLGSCDLATATNGRGCRMKFTHASSIAVDGKFYGMATLEWTLSSNAGILDGLGPLYTNSEFSVAVAEAMAVSRS